MQNIAILFPTVKLPNRIVKPVYVRHTVPQCNPKPLDHLTIAVDEQIRGRDLLLVRHYLNRFDPNLLHCKELTTSYGDLTQTHYDFNGHDNLLITNFIDNPVSNPNLTSAITLHTSTNRRALLYFFNGTQLKDLPSDGVNHFIGVGKINFKDFFNLVDRHRGSWEVLDHTHSSVTGIAAQAILSGMRRTEVNQVILSNQLNAKPEIYISSPQMRAIDHSQVKFTHQPTVEAMFFYDGKVQLRNPIWKFWGSHPNPVTIHHKNITEVPKVQTLEKLHPDDRDEVKRKLVEVLRFIAIQDQDQKLYTFLRSTYGNHYPSLFPNDDNTLENMKELSTPHVYELQCANTPWHPGIHPIHIPPCDLLELPSHLVEITYMSPYDPNHPPVCIIPSKMDNKTISLGRNGSNTIQINSHGVSRTHCQIYEENGQVLIKDLHSRNGTQVNNNNIESPTVLPADNLINISGHIFKVQVKRQIQ